MASNKDVTPTQAATNTSFINMLFETSKDSTGSEDVSHGGTKTKESKSNCNIGDFGPVFLALLAIVLCLVGGLTGYFVIERNELELARSDLNTQSVIGTGMLQNEIDQAIGLVNNVKTYMYLRDGDELAVDQTNEFDVFCNGRGSFPKQVFYFSYLAIVKDADASSWVTKMRAKGPDYASFYISYRDANNQPIPAPYADVHYVASLTSPLTFKATNGYDNAASSVRNASIQLALQTTTPIAGEKVTFSITTFSRQPGFNMYTAVKSRNDSRVNKGIMLTGFRAGDLIQTALDSMTKDVTVNVYDMNATDLTNNFMYSTKQWNATGAYYTDMPQSQAATFISAAPFYKEAVVNVATRVYKIVFIPTDSFIAARRTTAKIFVITAIMIFMLVLLILCVALFFGRRLYRTHVQRKRSREQFVILREYAKNLRGLLDKIASQEQKTRATVNALDDLIVVTNHTGKILQTNTSFDAALGYTESQLEKGVSLGVVVANIELDFLQQQLGQSAIQKVVRTKEGVEINVLLSVRALAADTTSPVQDTLIMPKSDTDEAYVVIMRQIKEQQV